MRSLLHIGQPDSLFPSTSSIPVICPLTGAGTTEDPGRVECCWQAAALPHYVRYHAKQFVCAFVVLVRAMVQRPTVAHVEDKASLKQLHFDLQTVSKLCVAPMWSAHQQSSLTCLQGFARWCALNSAWRPGRMSLFQLLVCACVSNVCDVGHAAGVDQASQ